MPKLQPQSRAAIDQIEPEVLVAGQVSVVAPTLAGDRRRAVQSVSEGATAIALEIANVVAELGGNNRLPPGVETALFEADSLVFDRPVDTRNRNFQIADALARAFGSLAEKILEGELHVDLVPHEMTTSALTLTPNWNVISPPIQNGTADPFHARFHDWVQTDSIGAGGVVHVDLPVITADSAGKEVAISTTPAGGSATRVNTSGTDTIVDGIGTNITIITAGGTAIVVSDGISNWIQYFAI